MNFTSALGQLGDGARDFAAIIAIATVDLSAKAGRYWSEHPEQQIPIATTILLSATTFGLFWFAHGLRYPRRKCLRCRGRGSFDGRFFQRDRSCGCCGGSGRHATFPKRMWNRMRQTNP